MPPPEHKRGFELYKNSLNSAKYVVAPMVDASELAWRMLSRKYGAELCYTPMWHSAVFARDEKYRKAALQTCPEDRPLIVQFCANDPEIFKKAVAYTVEAIEADAIDLNLGCPQVIARRGHFGSFLQDEWDLITRLVSAIHDNFDIPVTCKMRVFDDVQKTVDYAKMMESAGCQILTVHGRTREQKGAMTGLASWDHIRAVVQALKIPVIANGNIQYVEDVHRCIEATGVVGVMSAEGNLTNPAMFAGLQPPVWQMCLEYLDLAEKYPCPLSYSRGHMFKLLVHVLQIKDNAGIREIVAKGQSLAEFRRAACLLRDKYKNRSCDDWELERQELQSFKLKHAPWICQPYVRPPPEEHLKKLEETREKERLKKAAAAEAAASAKRSSTEDNSMVAEGEDGGNQISRKKMKKMERNPYKMFTHARENCKLCQLCPNPCGQKCETSLCRKCCKQKCFTEELDCLGHKIFVKSKRDFARKRKEEEEMKPVDSDNKI